MHKPSLATSLVLPALLAGCALFESDQELQLNSAVLKAESYDSQEALAEFYEKAAAEMQLRAHDARVLADQYAGKTYIYGTLGRDTMNRAQRLADYYERAAAENRRLAEIHRQVALQLPCKAVGLPGKGSLLPCHPFSGNSRSGVASQP
ncbi:hypothetical protein [Candidatus Methylocalor cossyra]|uniref:Uncharacterized protein n=1 Tax=Candidatus Methylocalor cossyra TaxID=3108543 RepID=A0ABM9NFR8_9GAMM